VIWNDEFLFLHYPKTGGKTLAAGFVEAWNTPIHAHISKGQMRDLRPHLRPGSAIEVGNAHHNLLAARRILKESGRALDDFRAIFVGIRNPYHLMCSAYFFQKEAAKAPAFREKFALAANSSLADYARETYVSDFVNWMTLDGVRLQNLRVVRFESMQRDFDALGAEFGLKPVKLQHLNAGPVTDYDGLLTDDLKRIIQERHRYLFDAGYYPRLETVDA
jgi:hypothetical protein